MNYYIKGVHLMGINKYSEEQIEKMSMIELANILLGDEKKELNFMTLFDKVADHKKFSQTQKEDLLARFYTDLNVDGRFTTLGANMWGLKRWYPVDQTSEKSLAESRKRDLEEDELIGVLDEEDFYDDDALVEEEDELDKEIDEYEDYDSYETIDND